MRKFIALLGIVFLFGCLFIPLANCESNSIGSTVVGAPSTFPSVDYFIGVNASTSGWADDNYTITNGKFYGKTGGGTDYAKIVIYDNSQNLVAESDAEAITTLGWYTFTFDPTVILHKSESYYSIGVITNTSGLYYYRQGGSIGVMTFIYDGSNDYSSPMDIDDALVNDDYEMSIYLNVETLVGATPTPSPSPTPAGGSGDGDELLEDWTSTIVTYLIPLLLILVPAFLGLKFLGSMGFFVGLNIGVIICYASGVSGIGLWTIILMAVVDLAYIFFNRR